MSIKNLIMQEACHEIKMECLKKAFCLKPKKMQLIFISTQIFALGQITLKLRKKVLEIMSLQTRLLKNL
jgi:hypothetical protein